MIKNRARANQNTEHGTCLPDRQAQNTDLNKNSSRITHHDLSLGSERGMVLIVSLLLLLVATVVGITALSTSTTNVMISGNQRLNEINFSAADSGVSVSEPVINDTAYNTAIGSDYTSIVSDYYDTNGNGIYDFIDEISGTLPMDSDSASTSPDLTFTMGAGTSTVTVNVDIDYLYAAAVAGGAIEFASGYEGLGKAAGAGGMEIYYGVMSVGQGAVGSENAVCALYRYVTK